MTRDNQDTIWVGTSEGVVKIDAKTHEMKRVLLPILISKTQRVISICVGTDGKVWIGTFDSGAFYISPDDPGAETLVGAKDERKEKEPLNENVFSSESGRRRDLVRYLRQRHFGGESADRDASDDA